MAVAGGTGSAAEKKVEAVEPGEEESGDESAEEAGGESAGKPGAKALRKPEMRVLRRLVTKPGSCEGESWEAVDGGGSQPR